MRALARRRVCELPAWAITALLGVAYLIAAPPSTDLSAAGYRSELFARAGFTLWDNSWYAGHHLPAYSVLAPALGALLGPQLLAALSMTIASGLFAALIAGRFPARATRVAALWFALGASISLLANRVPFDLGLALGIAALLAAQRRRRAAAALLAALCSLASPVAGVFFALLALAWALHRRAAWFAAALAGAALAPVALLVVAFPEGGTEPFVASAFYPALAGVIAIAALSGSARDAASAERLVRIGALLYAGVLIAAYVVPSALGGNADRLGALLGGPIAACVLAGGERGDLRRGLLLVLAPALLYWQANAPVGDFLSAAADPAVERSYYEPLLGELRELGIGYGAHPARIEVVLSRDHGEARFLAPHVMLARGWERQLDRYRDALFYESSPALTQARYRAWLSAQSASYVALPDAPLDYSSRAEAALLRASPLPAYLREVWHSTHWRLFAFPGAGALAQAPATLSALSSDAFTLLAPRAGGFTVRVHYTPYWALAGGHGCVARAPEDWTRVRTRAPGRLRVVIRFSLARVLEHGPRCS